MVLYIKLIHASMPWGCLCMGAPATVGARLPLLLLSPHLRQIGGQPHTFYQPYTPAFALTSSETVGTHSTIPCHTRLCLCSYLIWDRSVANPSTALVRLCRSVSSMPKWRSCVKYLRRRPHRSVKYSEMKIACAHQSPCKMALLGWRRAWVGDGLVRLAKGLGGRWPC